MIKYFTYSLLLLFGSNLLAQDILVNKVKNDIPSISDEQILDRFLTAVKEDYGLIYVDLSLEEVSETKMAGIENKTALIADFTIRAYNLLDESKVDYKTFKLSGSGKNINKARKSIVKSISRAKRKINKFLATAMTKAKVTDCSALNSVIDQYLSTQQHRKAYALASSRIDECEDSMWALKQKVYDAYQKDYCNLHITKVNAYLSTKEYRKAIREIQNVSPISPCIEDVKSIIKTIKNDYQSDYDQSFDAYTKNVELQILEEKDRRRIIDMFLINNIINDK